MAECFLIIPLDKFEVRGNSKQIVILKAVSHLVAQLKYSPSDAYEYVKKIQNQIVCSGE